MWLHHGARSVINFFLISEFGEKGKHEVQNLYSNTSLSFWLAEGTHDCDSPATCVTIVDLINNVIFYFLCP